jgi:hypothetical protein
LDGGLWIQDADAGSLYLIVQPFGRLIDLFNSRPVSAFVAAITLWDVIGRIRVWHRRRNDILERITAREALEVIREFGGNTGAIMSHDPPPELDLEVNLSVAEGRPELPERRHSAVQGVENTPEEGPGIRIGPIEGAGIEGGAEEGPGIEVGPVDSLMRESAEPRPAYLIDGVGAIGRQITHVRRYPDGTIDIIYVEC